MNEGENKVSEDQKVSEDVKNGNKHIEKAKNMKKYSCIKKMKSVFCGYGSQNEFISTNYELAACYYKSAKEFEKSAKSFEKAAKVSKEERQSYVIISKMYSDAACCYINFDKYKAIECYKEAITMIDLFLSDEKYDTSTKKWCNMLEIIYRSKVGEIYDKDLNQKYEALEYYQYAVDLIERYDLIGRYDLKHSLKHLETVAELKFELGEYRDACNIFENIATKCKTTEVTSPLSYIFKSVLCQFCISVDDGTAQMSKFLLNEPIFKYSNEYSFLNSLSVILTERRTELFYDLIKTNMKLFVLRRTKRKYFDVLLTFISE